MQRGVCLSSSKKVGFSSLCAEILASQSRVDECEGGGSIDWLHINVQQLLGRLAPFAVIERHTEPGASTLQTSQCPISMQTTALDTLYQQILSATI